MEENKQGPAYTLYFSHHCPKCRRFLQAIQPLTTAKYINYFDVQQKRPPPNIRFVPSLVDNKSGVSHTGSQAFDLLKLWVQGEQLKPFTPMSPLSGTGDLQYANLTDGLLDQDGCFEKLPGSYR